MRLLRTAHRHERLVANLRLGKCAFPDGQLEDAQKQLHEKAHFWHLEREFVQPGRRRHRPQSLVP